MCVCVCVSGSLCVWTVKIVNDANYLLIISHTPHSLKPQPHEKQRQQTITIHNHNHNNYLNFCSVYNDKNLKESPPPPAACDRVKFEASSIYLTCIELPQPCNNWSSIDWILKSLIVSLTYQRLCSCLIVCVYSPINYSIRPLCVYWLRQAITIASPTHPHHSHHHHHHSAYPSIMQVATSQGGHHYGRDPPELLYMPHHHNPNAPNGHSAAALSAHQHWAMGLQSHENMSPWAASGMHPLHPQDIKVSKAWQETLHQLDQIVSPSSDNIFATKAKSRNLHAHIWNKILTLSVVGIEMMYNLILPLCENFSFSLEIIFLTPNSDLFFPLLLRTSSCPSPGPLMMIKII